MCDVTAYCIDPPGCGKSMSKSETDYKDALCAKRKRQDYEKTLEFKGKKLGEVLITLPFLMVEGFFSLENLKILGTFVGIHKATALFYNVAAKSIAKGLAPEAMILANEMALKEGSMFATNVVMTRALAVAVEEGSAAAYLSTALTMTSAIGGAISGVLTIVMLLGAVLDGYDPLEYGSTLNHENLKHIVDEYNTAFRNIFLGNMDIGVTSTGDRILDPSGKWPIELDLGPMVMRTNSAKDDQDFMLYVQEYLRALKYNSRGEFIEWDRTNNLPLPLLSDFEKYGRTLDLLTSNGNTVVSNWLAKWWGLMLVLGLVVVAVVLIYI